MSIWVGGRAVQERKDTSNNVAILLLRKLGNCTEHLIDVKEVPLNIKGKWRLHVKGF